MFGYSDALISAVKNLRYRFGQASCVSAPNYRDFQQHAAMHSARPATAVNFFRRKYEDFHKVVGVMWSNRNFNFVRLCRYTRYWCDRCRTRSGRPGSDSLDCDGIYYQPFGNAVVNEAAGSLLSYLGDSVGVNGFNFGSVRPARPSWFTSQAWGDHARLLPDVPHRRHGQLFCPVAQRVWLLHHPRLRQHRRQHHPQRFVQWRDEL